MYRLVAFRLQLDFPFPCCWFSPQDGYRDGLSGLLDKALSYPIWTCRRKSCSPRSPTSSNTSGTYCHQSAKQIRAWLIWASPWFDLWWLLVVFNWQRQETESPSYNRANRYFPKHLASSPAGFRLVYTLSRHPVYPHWPRLCCHLLYGELVTFVSSTMCASIVFLPRGGSYNVALNFTD